MNEITNAMIWQQLNEVKGLLPALNPLVQLKPLLDNNELMKLLNVSESTLFRWRRDKLIPFYKIKRRCYYPREYFTHTIIQKILLGHDASKKFDE
jgi:hypothetical protein